MNHNKCCVYCQNEDQALCLLHCDSYNKDWYEFSLLRLIIFQLSCFWNVIVYRFNFNIAEIKAWRLIKLDKDWKKDWKELLK